VTIGKAQLGRLLAILVLVAGIAAAWRWRSLFDPVGLIELVGAGPIAPFVFIAIHILGSLFFVPRTLLALGAGMVFGIWWGVVWAAVGSLVGAVAGLLAARYVYAGFTRQIDPTRLRMLLARAERGGWRMVAILRLVPIIPHSLTNYALGLTRIGIGPYALGSLVGQLPLTIAYADLGAAGGRVIIGGADWRHEILWPSLVGLTALALSLLVPLIARSRASWLAVRPGLPRGGP